MTFVNVLRIQKDGVTIQTPALVLWKWWRKGGVSVFTWWPVASWWVAAGLCHTQLCAQDFVFPIEEDKETTKEK